MRLAGRASHRAQCWADTTSRWEPERWGRGGRERQAGVQLSLIQLHAAATTPRPVDTLCASQTNGLSTCSAAQFLSHRQAPPPLTHTHIHTHTHTHTHTGSHTPPYTHILSHTHNLTQPHTLLTHSSHTLTHPHILLTHLHTSLAHSSHSPQTHTLFTPSHTQSLHTHTYPHINKHTLHTLTHTQPHTLLTCTHTHTQSQSLQEWRHRKHGDPGAALTHQAYAACVKSPS